MGSAVWRSGAGSWLIIISWSFLMCMQCGAGEELKGLDAILAVVCMWMYLSVWS